MEKTYIVYRVYEMRRYGDLHAVVNRANTYQVAICNGGHDDEANARLIAAAPELLKALRDAQAWAVYNGINTTSSAFNWIAEARAAIAKATGDGR